MNPMKFKRKPFSIHFFLIAVIFLIFDIDVAICSELQCFDNRMKYMRVNNKPHSNTERDPLIPPQQLTNICFKEFVLMLFP